MTSVAVLDHGAGNLRNVARALAAVGADVCVTTDPDAAARCDRLVLPGVGAFSDAIRAIRRRGFDRLIAASIAEGKPLLGICVGYQVLFEEGLEFGRHRGLGIFAGQVSRFSAAVRVPHVGWNQVEIRSGPLFEPSLAGAPYFYFVHSYRAQGADPTEVEGWCEYDGRFPAMSGRAGIFGVQFHPEKSQRAGLQLLANFLAIGSRDPAAIPRGAAR